MHASIEAAPPVSTRAYPSLGRARTGENWRGSPALTIAGAILLVALLGYVDYLTGYEQTFLLFYLLPIALGTWFIGATFGFVLSSLSVAAWVISDLADRVPFAGMWNVGMAVAAYLVFTAILWKLRTLVQTLDDRVRDRTEALHREMLERERLDREISGIAERERRRLGQELHDTICQHLTGTALTAETLREKLASRSAPEVTEANKVVGYVEEGIDLVRNLARGFFAPELDAEGLLVALRGLAENTTDQSDIECIFEADNHIRVPDAIVATQLYKIAQEAVRNALKHSGARRVDIQLSRHGDGLALSVTDDGSGLPAQLPEPEGLGLRLMAHGAAMIGGRFRAARNPAGGTTVSCELKNLKKDP
jgi:signal transduction histidine kinase